MGIAWFDDETPAEEEAALRIGGAPLLPSGQAWPECARCELPLLFRAQVPLAVTSMVSYDDDRLLSIFECHARGGEDSCDFGEGLIRGGVRTLAQPPSPTSYSVVLESLGQYPEQTLRLAEMLSDTGASPNLPAVLIQQSPLSIAKEAARALEEKGAQALVEPSAPTVLKMRRGGRLIMFDDAVPGTRRTTLPPLASLVANGRTAALRGLFGGNTPGHRDHGYLCRCGRPTRTAVRLLAQRDGLPHWLGLGPTVVQVCLRCDLAQVHRSASAPRIAAAG